MEKEEELKHILIICKHDYSYSEYKAYRTNYSAKELQEMEYDNSPPETLSEEKFNKLMNSVYDKELFRSLFKKRVRKYEVKDKDEENRRIYVVKEEVTYHSNSDYFNHYINFMKTSIKDFRYQKIDKGEIFLNDYY